MTIIGLGTEAGALSGRAVQVMRGAKVILNTAFQPAAEDLKEAGIPFETLDFLYEKSRNYDTLAKNIAREIKKRAKAENICYCVYGAVTEDRAAQSLLGKNTQVIEGVGKAASAAAKAGLFGKYTSVSAYELESAKLALPLVIYDIADRQRRRRPWRPMPVRHCSTEGATPDLPPSKLRRVLSSYWTYI